MKIIRLPVTYHSQIKYCTEKDCAYILKSIFALANDESIKEEESMRFGIVQNLWRECVQMENKARAKKGEKWLNEGIATSRDDIEVRHRGATNSDQINSDQINSDQINSDQINSIQETIIEKTKLEITLEEFSKMRNKIKKPLTEHAKKLLLSELEKLSEGNEEIKIAILEQSILKCWQGVFPLKEEIKNKKEPFLKERRPGEWWLYDPENKTWSLPS